MEYKWGECEWAIFRDGELWTCSVGSEEECEDLINEYECQRSGEFTYKLISEDQRQGLMRKDIRDKYL